MSKDPQLYLTTRWRDTQKICMSTFIFLWQLFFPWFGLSWALGHGDRARRSGATGVDKDCHYSLSDRDCWVTEHSPWACTWRPGGPEVIKNNSTSTHSWTSMYFLGWQPRWLTAYLQMIMLTHAVEGIHYWALELPLLASVTYSSQPAQSTLTPSLIKTLLL